MKLIDTINRNKNNSFNSRDKILGNIFFHETLLIYSFFPPEKFLSKWNIYLLKPNYIDEIAFKNETIDNKKKLKTLKDDKVVSVIYPLR